MKKPLLLFLTIILNWQGTVVTKTDVYLCNSTGGKKYHYSKTCRGLSNCKAEIIKVSIQKAKTSGKELCGWED